LSAHDENVLFLDARLRIWHRSRYRRGRSACGRKRRSRLQHIRWSQPSVRCHARALIQPARPCCYVRKRTL